MLVTRIERQKKQKQRFSIFLDGEFAFGVSDAVLLKHGIRKGDELREEDVTRIREADSLDAAKRMALNYISFRPRSSSEVAGYLVRKGFTPGEAATVAQHFVSVSLINDGEFARMYVRDRLRRKPTGTALLKHELFRRGIPGPLADQVLNEIVSRENQIEAAVQLAQKKIKITGLRKRTADREKVLRQVFGYLLRRGFSSDVADSALRTLHV